MKTLYSIVIFVFVSHSAISVSIDQGMAERILKDTSYFLEFIDVAIANFGNEENRKSLREANQFKFEAHLEYLQGNYVRSFKLIKASQEILNQLYLKVVDYYLKDARDLLNISAPIIVHAKDKKAQLFLRLGYRDLESTRQFKDVGRNYTPYLYSNKIRYYIDSIKRARRSKRFAFLALLESKTPLEEKEEYKTQTIDEALRKVETEDISDYERVKNLLTNMLNRKLFLNKKNFFLHHDDNYALIHKGKTSVLKEVLEEEKKKQLEEQPEAEKK